MRGGKVIALWFFNISESRVAMLSGFSFANATKSTWIYRCGLLTPWQWYSSGWFPGQLGLGTPSCFWMWIAHTWIQKISFDDLLSITWGFECPTFDLEMVEDPWFKKNDQGWELGKLIVLQVCLEFTLGWKDPFAMEVEIISTLSECGYLSNTLQNSTLAVPTYMSLVLTVFPCSQLYLPQFLA